MNITPLQLAVVLVGIYLIVHALTALSTLAVVIWGIIVLLLAVLPGWNTVQRRI